MQLPPRSSSGGCSGSSVLHEGTQRSLNHQTSSPSPHCPPWHSCHLPSLKRSSGLSSRGWSSSTIAPQPTAVGPRALPVTVTAQPRPPELPPLLLDPSVAPRGQGRRPICPARSLRLPVNVLCPSVFHPRQTFPSGTASCLPQPPEAGPSSPPLCLPDPLPLGRLARGLGSAGRGQVAAGGRWPPGAGGRWGLCCHYAVWLLTAATPRRHGLAPVSDEP